MKKSSLESLISFIDMTDAPQDILNIREEMVNELAKSRAKADANRATYAELHDKVISVLESVTSPVTAQDIANELGIARGKIVSGLTRLWCDEVVVNRDGKVNTYSLA